MLNGALGSFWQGKDEARIVQCEHDYTFMNRFRLLDWCLTL